MQQLEIYILDRKTTVSLDPARLASGRELFDKMDRDMDAGWRMGPEFVAEPDRVVRGQIAASRLLAALENGNEPMVQAMCGYIASRLPEVATIRIDTSGEPLNTALLSAEGEQVL